MKLFKMLKPLSKASLIASALISTPAWCSNTNGFGAIQYVIGSTNGTVTFNVDVTTRSALPSCATSQPKRFAIIGTDAAGQNMAALLLTAYSLKKRIWVQGTGTCTVQPDTENVQYFNPED